MSDLAITPEMEVAEILVRCNAHIGAKIKVAHMARFVYRQRSDGVHLFEVKEDPREAQPGSQADLPLPTREDAGRLDPRLRNQGGP